MDFIESETVVVCGCFGQIFDDFSRIDEAAGTILAFNVDLLQRELKQVLPEKMLINVHEAVFDKWRA